MSQWISLSIVALVTDETTNQIESQQIKMKSKFNVGFWREGKKGEVGENL